MNEVTARSALKIEARLLTSRIDQEANVFVSCLDWKRHVTLWIAMFSLFWMYCYSNLHTLLVYHDASPLPRCNLPTYGFETIYPYILLFEDPKCTKYVFPFILLRGRKGGAFEYPLAGDVRGRRREMRRASDDKHRRPFD